MWALWAEVPDNFRRSVDGDKCIKRQMRQLLRLAEDKFPGNPLLKEDGTFALQDFDVSFEELVQRAPTYFSNLFHRIRSRGQYGQAVYHNLEKIYSELNSDPPVRKAWIALLRDIPKGSLKPLGSKM